MEGLIDSLNKDKWQEISAADRPDGFLEYHVNLHAHKQVDKTRYCYMIENDNLDPKKVILENVVKDPIKGVALLELKLSPDGEKIIGMDLDGDVVIAK